MVLNDLVTVIVAIYNAEQNLEKCIESVLGQSYKNIELILVNDGSTDNSLEICEKFLDIDSRVRIVDKENEGVSVSRNIGLIKAKGKYCCFLDADDWIEKKHVEGLLNCLGDGDIVVEGYVKERDNCFETCQLASKKLELHDMNINNSVKSFFINGYIHPCWNKLFKMELIRKYNISFRRDIHISEDSLFCLTYLKHSRKMVLTNLCTYHYCVKEVGISLSKKVYDDIFKIYEEVYEELYSCLLRGNVVEELIKEIANKTIYSQLYNSVIKILRNTERRYKEKKNLLNDMENRKYCEEVFKYMNPRVNNKGERIVLGLIIRKRYRLLEVILRWIIK